MYKQLSNVIEVQAKMLRFEILRDEVAHSVAAEIPPNVDPVASAYERPVNEVALAPFFISKYEMTQGQWARFTGNNPSAIQASWLFKGNISFGESAEVAAEGNPRPGSTPCRIGELERCD